MIEHTQITATATTKDDVTEICRFLNRVIQKENTVKMVMIVTPKKETAKVINNEN
jgi:hypothetical protein